jgi:lipoyl(octanoyl) transferase
MADARPRLTWLGQLPLVEAMAANARAVARLQATPRPELLAFEPAAPVYTLGKRAQTEAGRLAVASTLQRCASRQIAVLPVSRGGLGTLHAPGQLVVFVAWPCERAGLRPLVTRLLTATAQVCRDLGVAAEVDLGEQVGVWHPTGKLASLGLGHAHGVAYHGLALNVAVAPTWTQGLALCGSESTEFANVSSLSTAPIGDLKGIADRLAHALDPA